MKNICILLLGFMILSSCKKSYYYIDRKGLIHSNKRCDEIQGGILILNEDITSISGGFCGECMDEKGIIRCTEYIQYNNNVSGREKLLKYIIQAMKNTYPNMRNMSNKEIVDNYLSNDEDIAYLYDVIHSNELRINNLRTPNIPVEELLDLDKTHFIVRIKRWFTEQITGYSSEKEYEMDNLWIEVDSIIDSKN